MYGLIRLAGWLRRAGDNLNRTSVQRWQACTESFEREGADVGLSTLDLRHGHKADVYTLDGSLGGTHAIRR